MMLYFFLYTTIFTSGAESVNCGQRMVQERSCPLNEKGYSLQGKLYFVTLSQPHVLWLSCELNANSSMLTFSMYTPINTQRLDLFMDETNGKLTTETSDQPEKREAFFSFVF